MTDDEIMFNALKVKIDEILKTEKNREEKLKTICRLLKTNIPHYDWVGFYQVDKKKKDQLFLGPYEGEPTEHVVIPFGKGICGQAAKTEKTFLVQNVSKETNYLSCSSRVKSEIVVPVFKNKQIAGELDIDSHRLAPFTKNDVAFLNAVAEKVSELF